MKGISHQVTEKIIPNSKVNAKRIIQLQHKTDNE